MEMIKDIFRHGDIDSLKKLNLLTILRSGNNHSFRVAVFHGHLNIVKYLFDSVNGIGLTAEDARANHNQAIGYSCEFGHLDILKYLLDPINGPGLTIEDVRDNRNYALISACKNGQIDIVKYLFDPTLGGPGLTIEDARCNNNQPIISASENGKLEVVKYLIGEVGLTVGDVRTDENRAFIMASRKGHLSVVKYLFDPTSGVVLTTKDARAYNNRALDEVSIGGNIEIAKYLIETVGLTLKDVDNTNNDGKHTPLTRALLFWRGNFVKYFIETVGVTIERIKELGRYDVVVNYWGIVFPPHNPFIGLSRDECECRVSIMEDYQTNIPDLCELIPKVDFGNIDSIDTCCPICMDDLLTYIHYGKGVPSTIRKAIITKTECGHIFHSDCLAISAAVSENLKMCPMCRQKINSPMRLLFEDGTDLTKCIYALFL